MDCFNNVLATFLGLELGSSVAGGSENSRISLCSEDEQRAKVLRVWNEMTRG